MAFVVTTVALPDGEVGVAYSQTLATTGGVNPNTWTLKTGTLPTGLTLHAATGVVDGTPTVAIAATPLVFEATDSTPVTPLVADSSSIPLTIDAVLAITTSTLPPAFPGVAYSATLATTGGVAPLTWAVTAGVLPTGLSLGASTGKITGTPTQTFNSATAITFQATDNVSATASVTITLGLQTSVDPGVLGSASLSLPVQPFRASLTLIPGSGQLGNNASYENSALQDSSSAQAKQVNTQLKNVGNLGARVV